MIQITHPCQAPKLVLSLHMLLQCERDVEGENSRFRIEAQHSRLDFHRDPSNGRLHHGRIHGYCISDVGHRSGHCCGPMEIRDGDGREVEVQPIGVVSLACYLLSSETRDRPGAVTDGTEELNVVVRADVVNKPRIRRCVGVDKPGPNVEWTCRLGGRASLANV